MTADRRRVGIMGGTFDPIHHGHLIAANEVATRFALDEVIFVPTGQPWQKAGEPVSAAEDRYLMTVIATASNPRFTVSRVDIDRAGPTYTVDTLRDLRTVLGESTDLFFITGADALADILSWKEADACLELAHFVGVTRPGFRLSSDHLPADTVSLVQVPALAISSTDCRERTAAGQPVWYFVPDGVVQYIVKRRLYRGPALPALAVSADPAEPADRPAPVGRAKAAGRAKPVGRVQPAKRARRTEPAEAAEAVVAAGAVAAGGAAASGGAKSRRPARSRE